MQTFYDDIWKLNNEGRKHFAFTQCLRKSCTPRGCGAGNLPLTQASAQIRELCITTREFYRCSKIAFKGTCSFHTQKSILVGEFYSLYDE